jgi:hypothetical protein
MKEGPPIPQLETTHFHVAHNVASDHEGRSLQGHHLVKGIEHNGEMHGEAVDPGAPNERVISVQIPELMAERLTSFFDRFLVDPNPDDWVNCHRFAVWMTTGEMPEDSGNSHDGMGKDHPAMIRIAEHGVKVENPLATGQHGIMASTGDYGTKFPEHSVVGLETGVEGLKCIQITDIDGVMTLSDPVSDVASKNAKKDQLGQRQLDLYALNHPVDPATN